MTRPRKNPCVYTGKVGAKMRPFTLPRRKAPILRKLIGLKGGPLNGAYVRLDAETNHNSCTLPLAAMKGYVPGQYADGVWLPVFDWREPKM